MHEPTKLLLEMMLTWEQIISVFVSCFDMFVSCSRQYCYSVSFDSALMHKSMSVIKIMVNTDYFLFLTGFRMAFLSPTN